MAAAGCCSALPMIVRRTRYLSRRACAGSVLLAAARERAAVDRAALQGCQEAFGSLPYQIRIHFGGVSECRIGMRRWGAVLVASSQAVVSAMRMPMQRVARSTASSASLSRGAS